MIYLTYFQSENTAPIQSDQINQVLGGQGTPSPLSPTPSPAGSVGSVGSQSSGYGSGELAARANNPPVVAPTPSTQAPTPCMLVPVNVYHAMSKQNQHFTYLLSYQDLWDQADNLVIKGRHTGECSLCFLLGSSVFDKLEQGGQLAIKISFYPRNPEAV